MRKNESSNLNVALEFCDLARMDKVNAGLYYYNAACIIDNAIERCNGKYDETLKDLNRDDKNKLAYAYYHLACHPRIEDKLNKTSARIANPAAYFYAAVKLKIELPSVDSDDFVRLAKSSLEYYQSEEYYHSNEYKHSSRSKPESTRPSKVEELKCLLLEIMPSFGASNLSRFEFSGKQTQNASSTFQEQKNVKP